ncbi:double-strand break repair protein AddB [Methylocapsa polymorpha]|uniref:Double-strand break repair protein AddB n=1 Tax=Methylocapsa polymorpha TaxID=3080828 RepID=A0ABZ0HU51_9HYPH|nr:double-strand break repair protein AddB [Methylocapsa sp. RX1]
MLQPNVFTIAPGAPFLKTFAAALFEGRVVEGFSKGLGPLEMAAATIYVPTRRAARALADELAGALNRSATLLPRILPLGALEETETGLIFAEAAQDLGQDPVGDLPMAASEIARRMQLAELILAWARALRHAIVSIDPHGQYETDSRESCLVATTAADAWHLSGELAGLIDELIIEDVAWERLDPLVLPEFDPYWRITLDFLNIAIEHWPNILARQGLVDKARRQVALIERQSQILRDGGAGGPVIAIGSTGSNRATARLLAAIARAPMGAVVLPGLDQDLDNEAFALIAGDAKEGVEASFTHPQAALCRLLSVLQVRREEVQSLGEVSRLGAARGRFVSQALRPAETTDAWIAYRAGVDAAELDAALEGVAMIEAADEREEALALAIVLRGVLETPGETAALVTPDRELARRVRADLLRWGVDVDDSGGEPLSASPYGVLARLAIACAASGMTAESLAALLAHPQARLGYSREDLARLGALFEIGVLRSPRAAGGLAEPILRSPQDMIAAARNEALERFAHPAKRRITEAEWAGLQDLLVRLGAEFRPILDLRGEHDLKAWVAAHRAVIKGIARGGDGADHGEDREALDALFDELARCATAGMCFDAESYGFFFAAVAREVALRGPRNAHPRLKIFGLLEARLMEADVVLLGGLDETVWPPQAQTDAFLNRPMRVALGLTPPERKLGQTAHDFAQALGHSRVIMSRAAKRGGAPTTPSRFIQRMTALGDAAWSACAARGKIYLDLARAIDRPAQAAAQIKRPMPRPQLDLRPKKLSVTRVETLRRDPYAIYAEMILGLAALEPLGGAVGPAEFGSAVHAALERFVAAFPSGPLPSGAREKLCAILREGLAANLEDPVFLALQWPRLEKTIDFYLGFEARRRDDIREIKTEIDGKLAIDLADASVFTLTARADRIELRRDGGVTLVDYKTGTPPGKQEILVGFAPQLTLEAAMAQRGAFSLGVKINSIEALYLKLGGADGGKETQVDFKDADFAEVAARHYAGLVDLLNQFRDPETAYPPRPFPKFSARYNAYDHLARVKEWSLGGAEGGD